MMFTLSILATVLAYTWLVAPVAPHSAVAVPVLLVIGLAVARALKTGEWGTDAGAFVPALWRSALLTMAGVAVLYGASTSLGTRNEIDNGWAQLAVLLPWGLGQQFALHTVFLREAQGSFSRAAAAGVRPRLVAAAAFAVLHLPNPFLTLATFAGALGWCWIYDRFPNLLPLAVSHAVFTLAILYGFDDRITGGLRVGAAYLAQR
jgi:membrane protease YdiL (CAAX protease family)